MTSAADVADDVELTWQMTSPRADVSRGTLARGARGGAWERVRGPMKTKFHRKVDRRDFFPMMQSVV